MHHRELAKASEFRWPINGSTTTTCIRARTRVRALNIHILFPVRARTLCIVILLCIANSTLASTQDSSLVVYTRVIYYSQSTK